nr:tape measure protein [uncultured Tolumonas sp.]
MSNQDLKLALEIAAKVSGRDDISAMTKEVSNIGPVSEKVSQEAKALAAELNDLASKRDLIDNANKSTEALKLLEMATASSRSKLDALKQSEAAAGTDAAQFAEKERLLSAEVKQLESQLVKQAATHTKLDTALRQNNINITSLVSEQNRLQSEINQTVEKTAQLGQSLTGVSSSAATFSGHVSNVTARLLTMAGAYLGINKITESIKEMFSQGDKAELLQNQMNAVMGSIEKGKEATAWIQQFAKDTPLQVDQVTEAFTTLKAFGLDPMDGTLQGVVDESYKLGKGFEGVQRVSLALGQAWAKQKLQGEEIMQLVEAGVPVWDLLAQATGKNTQELSKLSEQGALGRDVIKKLMDEMAKGASGAAAANMSTLSGLISNATDNLDAFYRMVANSGSLDWLKSQIADLNAKFDSMAADGSLKKLAQGISSAIQDTGSAVVDFGKAISKWSDEIKLLGEIWLALKISKWESDLSSITAKFITLSSATKTTNTDLTATGAASTVASVGLTRIGTAGRVAAVGLTLVKSALTALLPIIAIELVLKMVDATMQWYDANVKLQDSLRLQAKTSDDLKAKYAEISQQTGITITNMKQFDELIQKGAIHFDEATKTYKKGPESLKAVGDSAVDASKKLNVLSGSLADLGAKFQGVKPGTDAAKNAVKASFDEMDLTSKASIGNVLRQLDALQKSNKITSTDFRDGLGKTLKELSADQLQQFKSSVDSVSNNLTETGKKAKETGDQIHKELFSRLGLDLDEMRNGVTKSGAETISVFNQIATSGENSSAEIRAAFSKAIDSSKTVEEAKKLVAILQTAGRSGAVAGNDMSAGMEQAKSKAAELSEKIHGIADAYHQTGVTSTADLQDAVEKHKAAYQQITAAGTESVEQQKAVFMTWARAEVELAVATGKPVPAMIESKAAALGLTDQLAALESQITGVDGSASAAAGSLSNMGGAAASASQNVGHATNNWSKMKDGNKDLSDSMAQTGEDLKSFDNATRSFDGWNNYVDNQEAANSAMKTYTLMVPAFKAETIDASKATEYMSMSVADLSDEVEKNTKAYLNYTRTAAEAMGPSGVNEWIAGIEAQSAATRKYYAELGQAAIAVKNVQAALSENPSETLINRAEHAIKAYSKLGEQNLSGLRSAIDSARSKMDSLNAATQSTLNSLRDQADELNNNTAAIENRRYEVQVAELKTKLAEAESLKNEKSKADMQEALRLAQEIHNQKLATIKAEQDAAKSEKTTAATTTTTDSSSSSSSTSSSDSNKKITVSLQSQAGAAEVTVNGESDLNNLLSLLKQHGLRTS